jgi:hypothetical protein
MIHQSIGHFHDGHFEQAHGVLQVQRASLIEAPSQTFDEFFKFVFVFERHVLLPKA